jgi:hypothetical protein
MYTSYESQLPRSIAMKPQSTFSPISLRYVAALRGNKPKPAGKDFIYAEAACANPERLVCLAASNPEGRFYGFVANDVARRAAEDQATQRGIFNVVFLVGSPSQVLARITNGSSLPPMLDYLCCDESLMELEPLERAALFDLAQKRLNPGGLFATSYKAYPENGGALNFLIHELAPEMNAEQQQEFLAEIKRLGVTYLAKNPGLAAKLNEAIVKGTPSSFFSLFDKMPTASGTFDTLVAMRSRGMEYAGDLALSSNYVDFAVPAEAQALVIGCRTHVLYEPIKDLALDRTVRSDIWVKPPAEKSLQPSQLFGGFAYGITLTREQIPALFTTHGKAIDLSGPLYTKLIDLMAVMPIGLGDFMSHPSGKDENAEKALEAIQILVACGIAAPMRGLRAPGNHASIAQPRLVGSFNRYLDKTDITDKEVWFASQVMGCGVSLSARDAFVMQALNRAGLSNSVSALMPELRRIAPTGAAMPVMQTSEPTTEIAQSLIREVVGQSLTQWYAYALLEAA